MVKVLASTTVATMIEYKGFGASKSGWTPGGGGPAGRLEISIVELLPFPGELQLVLFGGWKEKEFEILKRITRKKMMAEST